MARLPQQAEALSPYTDHENNDNRPLFRQRWLENSSKLELSPQAPTSEGAVAPDVAELPKETGSTRIDNMPNSHAIV